MHVLFACPHHDPANWLPAALFAHEKNLKALFNLGAGVDALLNMPELPAHIQIVRLEDAGMSVQMAEYALYALLRVSRGFAAYEQDQAAGRWNPQQGLRREQWPVGVLGLGKVGERVARAIASFDYPVAGWSRSAHAIGGVQTYAGAGELPRFLQRTRVLVNMLPLTDETAGMLDRGLLSQLLPGAYVINAGRGEHLNEADLLALLDEGRIHGATLDVFATEPLPQGHPFWKHPRVHVTPHIAASTLREETIVQICAKIRQLAKGEPLSGVVARGRGY